MAFALFRQDRGSTPPFLFHSMFDVLVSQYIGNNSGPTPRLFWPRFYPDVSERKRTNVSDLLRILLPPSLPLSEEGISQDTRHENFFLRDAYLTGPKCIQMYSSVSFAIRRKPKNATPWILRIGVSMALGFCCLELYQLRSKTRNIRYTVDAQGFKVQQTSNKGATCPLHL